MTDLYSIHPNQKLLAFDDSRPVDSQLYKKLVGSLIWLLTIRLDLSFFVGLLARFMSKFKKTHRQGL